MVLQDGVSPREKPYTGHHGGFPFMTGGVSLATNRYSLNNPDLTDVGAVMIAFEAINNCAITLYAKLENTNGNRQLVWLAQALDTKEDVPDPKVLASVKCHLGCGSHRTIEAALMWTLYQLDFQISQAEMERTKTTA